MWLYKNKEVNSVSDMPKNCHGFVYIIKNTSTNQYYIGKKQLQSATNKKLGKKELAALPISKGRKPTKKKIVSESNWVDYWSSSKVLQEQVKTIGENNFTREILEFCFDKRQLTYLEVKYQFKYSVLEDPLSLNDSILGSFYKAKDLVS